MGKGKRKYGRRSVVLGLSHGRGYPVLTAKSDPPEAPYIMEANI